MYLVLIFLPLISFLMLNFFGRFLGSFGGSLVSLFCMFFCMLICYFVLYEVGLSNSVCYIETLNWIDSEFVYLTWSFYFDSVTSIMLIVVTTVSFFVHMYSMSYMETDCHLTRFMSYLSLFTFFMLILVTGNNFVQMFVGWEGVGLASYLLINFWFTRIQANKSAIKAMIVNRIGDFGLVLGIGVIYCTFKSLDFQVVFSLVPYFKDDSFIFLGLEVNLITLISILLFIGAVGKSAQLGLHVWLPDAMEGPTPVSALIHAATMVTAGVFVLIRCCPILEYSNFALTLITIVGGLTAFFAATTGLLQNDLKRVIAYSTCSQLGYMVFACGLSNYSVSLFHLMNHAFFKALLFLSAGAIIHAIADEQDMRKMGGLYKLLPITYVMILIGSLALMGFPFLTGFYSKDVILEVAYAKYNVIGTFVHWLGTISAFFTAFYSFRLIYLTFLGKANGYKGSYRHIHEPSRLMRYPLYCLALGSIFLGYVSKDMIIGLGTNFWQNSLFFALENSIFIDAEFLPVYVKLIPVIFSLSGAVFSLLLYLYGQNLIFTLKKSNFGQNLYTFLNQKWYFDQTYYFFIIRPILNFGYKISFKEIDRGFIELFGPLGFVRLFNSFSKNLNNLQSGYIFHYVFIMVIGLFFFLLLISLNFYIVSIFFDNRIFIILLVLMILKCSNSLKNNL